MVSEWDARKEQQKTKRNEKKQQNAKRKKEPHRENTVKERNLHSDHHYAIKTTENGNVTIIIV